VWHWLLPATTGQPSQFIALGLNQQRVPPHWELATNAHSVILIVIIIVTVIVTVSVIIIIWASLCVMASRSTCPIHLCHTSHKSAGLSQMKHHRQIVRP